MDPTFTVRNMNQQDSSESWVRVPIKTGTPLYVSKYSVSNMEYLEFINTTFVIQDEIKHLNQGYYKRLNIYNLGSPFLYVKKKISIKSEMEDYPVCNISHFAALEYAHYKGAKLLSHEAWSLLLNLDKDIYIDAYTSNALNVKDRIGHTWKVKSGFVGPSGICDLVGNVRCWGMEACETTAYCYGLAFNKSIFQSNEMFVSQRMKRFGSVSVGIRLMKN